MVCNLKGRHFLTLADFTREEIETFLETAKDLKLKAKRGEFPPILSGKSLAMIFEKPSTRTRVSFEVAMYQLGGYALYLSKSDLQLGRGETIADTARVLSRYVDCIMARVYSHSTVEELAKYSSVPVINGLSDKYHPTQVLGDLLTVWEKKGKFEGLKLVYVGDGANNMAHSLLYGATIMGMDITICSPQGYHPDKDVLEKAREFAKRSGSKVEIITDPKEGVKGADIIYTDVWVSMGQESEKEARMKIFQPYRVDTALVSMAKEDAIVMHCLPAHRGEEITDDVMDGPRSVVFDEAENRLHAHKAILALVVI
ncbi:MAG: ornithine carbamoyltransferase [Synergistetes bacterium]|nr:MAG: Ornithine carbamoyltransferase, catabolic [bacterium 42_11]MBC7331731.1 ornithine carbamoyltransferase [Synergistota bacterium]MDK2870746.1 ornithine carbamoyltransferase [bacterium]